MDTMVAATEAFVDFFIELLQGLVIRLSSSFRNTNHFVCHTPSAQALIPSAPIAAAAIAPACGEGSRATLALMRTTSS
jgi:hypothetical protein